MQKLIILITILTFYSCKKEKNEKIEELSLTNTEVISQYSKELANDADFISNYKIDKSISIIENNYFNDYDDIQINTVINNLKSSKNNAELKANLTSNHFRNIDQIIVLFENKEIVLRKVFAKFPKFAQLSKIEFNSLFLKAYHEVRNKIENSNESSENCLAGLNTAIGDCDDDFAVGTAGAVAAAALATVFGTPLAGAVTLTVGMATVYTIEIGCKRRANRNYQTCLSNN
jgi:hypothetical protein